MLTIEGRTSTASTARPGKHWVVVSLPAEADIDVTDSGLNAAILNWVAQQNALAPDARHEWNLDDRSNANLFKSTEPGALIPTLASQFTIVFTQLTPPQTDQAQRRVRIPFCFKSLAPPAQIKTINVQVLTLSAFKPPTGANTLTESLPSLEANVTATALLTDGDFSTPAEKSRILKALSAIAQGSFSLAKEAGLRIGAALNGAGVTKAERAVSAAFLMDQPTLPGFSSDWPSVGVHIDYQPTGNIVLQVIGVKVAKSARIEVDLGGLQPSSPGGLNRAVKLACQTETRLNEQFAGELAGFIYKVPTFDQIDTLRSDIAQSSEINPAATPVTIEKQNQAGTSAPTCASAQAGTDPRVIVFRASNRWRSFGFKASAGIGYSQEQKVTGTGTFEADNLLLKIRDNAQPRETESINYTGGTEVQKLDAKWALDWTHQHPSLAESAYGLHLFGNYLRDNDQRFGNLSGPHLRDREAGGTLAGTYSFVSKPLDADGNDVSHRFGLSASSGIEYRRVEVRPATGNSPPLLSGEMTALLGDLMFNDRYAPNKIGGGFGGWELTVSTHLVKGLEISDFVFTRVSGEFLATIYFGHHHPRDFFLRMRKGAGSGTVDTPIFELFRLGGPDNLRGIEQGEFVGRKIGYEQFEAGISVREIVSWFSKTHSTPSEPSEPSPLDLSRFYVKAFYDRGRVADQASFADLVVLRHALKGYGFAVEIQGLQAGSKRVVLSIGYARSPDSVLHKSGMAITGASISF